MVGKFFRTRLGSSGGLISDCYWLARYYGRHPDEFLSLPMSEVFRHIHYTNRLIAEEAAEAELRARERG